MPRAKGSTNNPTTTANVKISTVINYFRAIPLEIAEIALDLATDAVRERKAKSNKAKAATAGAANAAVDAATGSAIAGDGASTGTEGKKKPGPPKGFRRGQKKTGDAGSTATESAAPAGHGTLGDAVGEVTDPAALPPQVSDHQGEEMRIL